MRGQLDVATPTAYLAALEGERKAEVTALHKLIRKTVPGLKPFIHSGMLAYGPMRYRYASGKEGEWFRVGVASNASYISLYVCSVVDGSYVAERYKAKLPKAKIGKSCVRFKRLADLDLAALRALLEDALRGSFGT